MGVPETAGKEAGHYDFRCVATFLKAWVGRPGKAWRKENGFETGEDSVYAHASGNGNVNSYAGAENAERKEDDENEE